MSFGIVMEDTKVMEVTSTAKSLITILIMGVMFSGAVFFWGLPFIVIDNTAPFSIGCGMLGLPCFLQAIYTIMEYCNKRMTVSEDGVEYVSAFGKKTYCKWDDVQVRSRATRGFVLIFKLHGKKVVLGGHYANITKMCESLTKWGKFSKR